MFYKESFIGFWHYKEKNRIYLFFKSGVVQVRSPQRTALFQWDLVVSKKGTPYLVIDKKHFVIVNVSPRRLSLFIGIHIAELDRLEELP